MLSSFRDRFGAAGLVVAIIALVVALAGGAYAASGSGNGGAIASKGKKAKAGPRGPKGPKGATGATGPAGPAGANGKDGAVGKDGAAGSNGANGTDGAKGPTGPTGKTGNPGAPGAPGEVGPTGATGPTGTFGGTNLPIGVTEKGYWTFHIAGTQEIETGEEIMQTIGDSTAFAQISFPDPLENGNQYFILYQTDPEFAEKCGTGENGAGGTPENPAAPQLYLCIFLKRLENATYVGTSRLLTNFASPSLSPTGATMKFTANGTGPASGNGTWAVTGGPTAG